MLNSKCLLVTAILTFFFTLPSQSFSAEKGYGWKNLGEDLNPYPSDFSEETTGLFAKRYHKIKNKQK